MDEHSSSNYWTRSARSRISRRGVFRGAALGAAGLAGAALIGCSSGGSSTSTPAAGGSTATASAAGTPKRGGTLTLGLVSINAGLDPALSLSTADATISLFHYDNLVQRMEDFSLRPMLAKTWEPNGDNSEYVFHLRENVKFHHGKDFKAEDVVYTIKRLKDPKTASAAAAPLSTITKIEAVDDLTVKMTLDAPNVFLPDTLSLYQGRILPSDVDPAKLNTGEYGTGPYTMESYDSGTRGTWKRWPDYWGADGIYPDELVANFIPDPSQRSEALKSGQIDVLFPVDPADVQQVNAAPKTTVLNVTSPGYLTLSMFSDEKPFDDQRVRTAIQLLHDRGTILDAAFYGLGGKGNDHPFVPEDPMWWDGQTWGPYDPKQAKQLLSAAGHDSLDLTLYTSTVAQGMVEYATAFKQGAAPGGVNIDIVQSPEDSYWSDVWLKKPFTCVQWNGRPDDQALSIVYLSDADWNESHYKSDKLDSLIKGARGQTEADRKQSYADVQKMLIDLAIRPIPVHLPVTVGLRDRVGGIKPHPGNWLLVYGAYLKDA